MSNQIASKKLPNNGIATHSANLTNLLAQYLGYYIPGYSFFLSLVRDNLGLNADKIIAVLGVLFGGWATVSYLRHTLIPRILSSFTSALIVDRDDQMYDDFTEWISKQKVSQYARLIRLVGNRRERSSSSYSYSYGTYSDSFLSKSFEKAQDLEDNMIVPEQAENVLFDYAAIEAKRPLRFEPWSGTYWFFYKYRLFLFSLGEGKKWGDLDRSIPEDSLQLTCIGLSTQPLKSLVELARSDNYEARIFRTNIFRPGRIGSYSSSPSPWCKVASRPSRPLETIVLSQGQKSQILTDMNTFLHPKRHAWYAARGIPYRRGYLFSGPPGTGKTSVCYAMAGIFGLDIFVASLGDGKLGDGDLSNLLTDLPARCLVVLEDIDVAVGKREDDEEDSEEAEYSSRRTKALSLSSLLNHLDGLGSKEGHILIMTTNAPESLDDALKRPGRVDLHVRFLLASRKQIKEIFIRMYCDDKDEHRAGRSRTSMTLETACRESSELTGERECPFMSPSELLAAGEEFASNFEEEAFSPAEVQGFLLSHKGSPQSALEEVKTWIPAFVAAKEKAAAEGMLRKQRRAARRAEREIRRFQRDHGMTKNALRELINDKLDPDENFPGSPGGSDASRPLVEAPEPPRKRRESSDFEVSAEEEQNPVPESTVNEEKPVAESTVAEEKPVTESAVGEEHFIAGNTVVEESPIAQPAAEDDKTATPEVAAEEKGGQTDP